MPRTERRHKFEKKKISKATRIGEIISAVIHNKSSAESQGLWDITRAAGKEWLKIYWTSIWTSGAAQCDGLWLSAPISNSVRGFWPQRAVGSRIAFNGLGPFSDSDARRGGRLVMSHACCCCKVKNGRWKMSTSTSQMILPSSLYAQQTYLRKRISFTDIIEN